MLKKIIECVPNISEGRNKDVINSVVEAIKTANVQVLDVDIGFDTNRTVITFVGSPASCLEASFNCIKKASELIDMSKHKGEHPRQGATDVCPFIPLSNVTMDECVELAKKLGEKVAKELGIPIYLYGYAASSKEREDLAFVRKGEYESLEQKIPTLKPDFGPSSYNDIVKKSGATNISARDFLIAYNVNLNTKDKSLAQEIALNIREAGRAKRDLKGEILKDSKGESIKIPGLLTAVKAIGWYIEEYKIAQISINLTNYHSTPIWKVFETCSTEAAKLGLRVTGSELVGLVPKECILEAGKYFLNKAKRSTAISEKELIHIAVKSLGLDELSSFKIEEKIIEYKIAEKNPLLDLKLKDFIDEVAKDSPAPGGGSVSALAGALSASLGAMVASLSPSKKNYEHTLDELNVIGQKLIENKDYLSLAIDNDTNAFNSVISALRLAKNSDEEKKHRELKLEEAYKEATLVPFNTAKACLNCIELLPRVAELGLINSASDIGVALYLAEAGFEGAILNVLINFNNIKDDNFKKELNMEIETLRLKLKTKKEKILNIVNKNILNS